MRRIKFHFSEDIQSIDEIESFYNKMNCNTKNESG
jgi:hypothetical protein